MEEQKSEAGLANDQDPQDATMDDDSPIDSDPVSNTEDGTNLEKLDTLRSTKSIAETLPLPQEILFVAIVCLAQLTAQSGLGQALAILHIIGNSFGITDPADLSWLIAGYSLTVGTFILISGRLGDMFGYKRMFIIGFSWFSLWSMIAGLAVYSNHVLFVFARVFQGIGPAITMTNGLALLGATYAPGRRKAMVFAFFGATAPGGAILGSVFAALLALAWWPWAFWSLSITLAIIAVVACFVIPDPPKKREIANKSFREKIIDLDLPGAFIGITALVLFNFAWNQAPIVGWQEPYVYVLLIIGILLVPVFFYNELRLARSPLIPFDALTSDVSFVLACVACGWSCFGIWVFYLWQFLQNLRHVSPILSTAQLSPVAVSGALASVGTGILLSRVRPAVVMLMALTAFTTGAILAATAPIHQTYWAQTFVNTVIMPWGMDMSFPAATLILSNAVAKEHQGMAASLVMTVVNYSISLGLGFAGTVEVHVNHGGATTADTLLGYRAALYMAVGLGGLGMGVSTMFLAKSHWRERHPVQKKATEEKKNGTSNGNDSV